MDELRLELDHLKQEHNKMKLSINSRLSRMQKEQENKSEKNQQSEQTFGLGKKELRKQVGFEMPPPSKQLIGFEMWPSVNDQQTSSCSLPLKRTIY